MQIFRAVFKLFLPKKRKDMQHTHEHTIQIGASIEKAEKIVLLLHGRGATADNILGLSMEFRPDARICYIAPQATHNAWYPQSFMEPTEKNEPWLSSALQLLEELVQQLLDKGKTRKQIVIAGFSQGACLATEFASRNAARYGGVIAFSGGLIGDVIEPSRYSGDFARTPVFLGCSDVDMHIPEARVHETARLMEKMGARVKTQIYPNMPHTINQDEILKAQAILDKAGK